MFGSLATVSDCLSCSESLCFHLSMLGILLTVFVDDFMIFDGWVFGDKPNWTVSSRATTPD